jgi:hypothetical protein
MAKNADSRENSLIIPCRSGNSQAETSSLQTASTTNNLNGHQLRPPWHLGLT